MALEAGGWVTVEPETEDKVSGSGTAIDGTKGVDKIV